MNNRQPHRVDKIPRLLPLPQLRPMLQCRQVLQRPVALTLTALLMLLLSACSRPLPAPPVSKLVSSLSNSADSSSAALPDPAWWQQLGDPVLNQLIDQAAKNNLDVQVAYTRWQQAHAGLRANQSRALPNVALTGSLSKSQSSLPDSVKRGQPDTNAARLSLNAQWELDAFGGIAASTAAAQREADAAAWGISGAQLLVLGEVAQQYVVWQGAAERLRVLEQMLANLRKTQRITQHLQQEGVASGFDLARLAAEISSTEANLPALRALMAVTEHHLSVLCGQNPNSSTPKLQELRAQPLQNWLDRLKVPRAQPIELLQRRPDLRAAERQLAAVSAQLAAAKADRYPKLVLNAIWGEQKLNLNGLGLAASPYSSLALAFSQPLLNRGQINANISAKTAQEQQALLQYDRSVLNALEQLANSLSAAEYEQQRLAQLQESVAQRQKAIAHANSLYREGQTGLLPLLDAQRSELNNQLGTVDSTIQQALNLVNIYQAMGGGWQAFAQPDQAVPATAQNTAQNTAQTKPNHSPVRATQP